MCCTSHRNYIKPKFDVSASGLVIVYPFENLSSHPNGGDIVTANFLTELRSKFSFKILDADFIVINSTNKKIKDESDLDITFLNINDKIKLAKKKNADFIIYGKVTEFKYKKGLGEEPVVGLNVQMVNVNTLEVVWHASVSITKGFFRLKEQSLNRYSQRAVKKILKKLK